MKKYENRKDNNNNQILGNLYVDNVSIEFRGSDNILYCNDTKLQNCKIRFTGSNSIIFLEKTFCTLSLNIRVGNDSVFYLGSDCYLNKTSNVYATERRNIIIGSGCLLSFNNYFRTADPHLIYDCQSKERINFSRSILIGDHVWIGQECLILKGCVIGSGAIIGGHSVLCNKKVKSNNMYAGNPARKIKENVFFKDAYSTHDYTYCDVENSKCFDSDLYTYKKDDNTIGLSKIDEDLRNIDSSLKRLDYIKNNLSKNKHKNRFFL